MWRPFLIKDIKLIEQIQRRATKFILNDFHSDYYNRLVKLQFLPIMYMFELYDVMFLVKSLKSPSPCFHITDYVSFSHSSTRSSSTNKLQHIHSRNNYIKNFYFNRLPRIWNSLPPIDLSLPTIIIKTRLYKFFWNHFLLNFQSDNPCTFHFICPCCKCTNTPHTPAYR